MPMKTAVVALAVLCCLALVSCGDDISPEGGNSSATGKTITIYPDPAPEDRADSEPSSATPESPSPHAGKQTAQAGKTPTAAKAPAHQGTIRISAEKLYAAYGDDSEQADKVYLDKQVAVNGEIWRVVVEEKDMFGKMSVVRHPYVTFRSGSDFGSVQCFFEKSDADALRGLEPGKTITIIGECAGRKGYVQNVHIRASRLAL